MKKRSATIGCSRFARNASINTGGQRIYGYPEGFELELRVISDADSHELDSQLIRDGRAGHLELDEQGLPPPEMLRFAVPFADGSNATNTTPVSRDLNTPPDGPGYAGPGWRWRWRCGKLATVAVDLAAPTSRLSVIHLRMAGGLLARGRTRARIPRKPAGPVSLPALCAVAIMGSVGDWHAPQRRFSVAEARLPAGQDASVML